MKLKLKKTSDVEAEYEPLAGFFVTVRQLGLDERQAFHQATHKGSRGQERFDFKLFCKAGPAAYLADWRGLTVSHLRQMLSTGLAEVPETDADGCILFDAELAEGLFEFGVIRTPDGATNFGVLMQDYSLRIEADNDATEQIRKNSLGGSASTGSSLGTGRPASVES